MPPTVPALATNTNARKYILEVDVNHNLLSPAYTPMGGVKAFTFASDDAQMQDDRRFADGGAGRMNKSGTGWNANATVSRAPQVANLTQYDVVQEFLRNVSEQTTGASAEANIRWYEYQDPTLPRIQAYAGTALVQYNEPNGGPLDNSDATFAFTGQGLLLKPVIPYPVAAQVPLITSVSNRNLNAAGGQAIVIKGQFMTGVTAVTFGGTAATNITSLDDSTLVVTVPAHAAGTVALVVTNGTGASVTGGTVTYA